MKKIIIESLSATCVPLDIDTIYRTTDENFFTFCWWQRILLFTISSIRFFIL